MQSTIASQLCATFMSGFLAYVMWYSYETRPMTKQLNKKLFKYSIAFALGQLLLFDIFVFSYDFRTGAHKTGALTKWPLQLSGSLRS